MRFILRRLREASSWAGISAALGALGGQLDTPAKAAVFCLAAGAAVAAVLLKENGAPDQPA